MSRLFILTTLVPDIITIPTNSREHEPFFERNTWYFCRKCIGPNRTLVGFDDFANLSPFTMKTLDAHVPFCPIPQTIIAWWEGAKSLLNSKCTDRIKHCRIIRISQAWHPIYVLTSSLPHPSPICRLHQDVEACSLHCFPESTMFPIQILHRPRRSQCATQPTRASSFIPKEALHYLYSILSKIGRAHV